MFAPKKAGKMPMAPVFSLPSKVLKKVNPKRKKMDAEDRADARKGIKQTKKEERGEKS